MRTYSDNLSDRFMAFIVNILKLEKELCRSYAGRHIFGQLFRSGSSSGANYEEARAAESRADFIHKMQVVLKELRESRFWLKLIISSNMVTKEELVLKLLYEEAIELSKIIAKSVVTAKSKSSKNSSRQ